uniref:USP domain-containing protein n=1 Tax=Rhizochromulina marina TaxID=1034831 RepID=A0A7S2RQP4_9STRA
MAGASASSSSSSSSKRRKRRKRSWDDEPRVVVSGVDEARCLRVLRNPEDWVCADSGTTDSVWLCLADGQVLTASAFQSRCLARRPATVFGLKLCEDESLVAWWGGGERRALRTAPVDEVDNNQGQLQALRAALDHMYGRSERVTRSGRRISAAEPAASSTGKLGKFFDAKLRLRRFDEDQLRTAVFHWTNQCAAKCFASWKLLKAIQRAELEHPSTPVKASRSDQTRIVSPCGLRNLGNTCYMNSVVQALAALPALSQLVAQHSHSRGGGAQPLTKTATSEQGARRLTDELDKVFSSLASQKLIRFTPDGLLNFIWELSHEFHGFRQHDAEELLICILSKLETEIGPAFQQSFGGSLQQRIEWGTKGISKTEISFLGQWSIDIPEESHSTSARARGALVVCSLYDCLDQATGDEVLTGDNMYEVKPGTRVHAVKRTLLHRLPEVLIIHINRTAWRKGTCKIQTSVDFPLDQLDLRKYATPLNHGSSCTYQCYAVIEHHGRSMNNGHFTAYARKPEGTVVLSQKGPNSPRRTSSEWFHFNDSRVAPCSSEIVQQAQAYILFYQKLTPATSVGIHHELAT